MSFSTTLHILLISCNLFIEWSHKFDLHPIILTGSKDTKIIHEVKSVSFHEFQILTSSSARKLFFVLDDSSSHDHLLLKGSARDFIHFP